MRIKIESRRRGAAPRELKRLLDASSPALPDDYLALLGKNNGLSLTANRFPSVPGVGVRKVMSVSEVLAKREILADRLPKDAWPVAFDDCGNYIVLFRRSRRWTVGFWDHETEKIVRLAARFTELLDSLEPFAPVIDARLKKILASTEVWIDPAFERQMRQKKRRGT
jgi:hypothetical protein